MNHIEDQDEFLELGRVTVETRGASVNPQIDTLGQFGSNGLSDD